MASWNLAIGLGVFGLRTLDSKPIFVILKIQEIRFMNVGFVINKTFASPKSDFFTINRQSFEEILFSKAYGVKREHSVFLS